MHEVNHPGTRHIRNNIWQIDPREVTGGKPVELAWFSPDCKHFSKAKGGKPREKSIRDLAWVVVLWAQRVKPDVILLENVEEFRTWGPLDDDGKPIKERAGETFDKWCRSCARLGYKLQFRELRACDYGAPTIRKRFFMIARRDGRPIVWPEPTHGKPGSAEVLSGKRLPWRTAAEIIDWSIPCPSIFERKKPLADKTLRRIAHGIMKFVVNNPRPFIVPLTHHQHAARAAPSTSTSRCDRHRRQRGEHASSCRTSPSSANGAIGTRRRAARTRSPPTASSSARAAAASPLGVVEAVCAPFRQLRAAGRRNRSARIRCTPSPPADGDHNTVVAAHLIHRATASAKGRRRARWTSRSRSAPSSPAGSSMRAVSRLHAEVRENGKGVDPTSRCTPSWPAPRGRRAHLAQFSETREGASSTPATRPRSRSRRSSARGRSRRSSRPTWSSCAAPARTASRSTSRSHDQRGRHPHGRGPRLPAQILRHRPGPAAREPLHTVTTKDRFGLVTVTIEGEEYVIVDIGMRMLTPRELFNAQGFPPDYIIDRDAEGRRSPRRRRSPSAATASARRSPRRWYAVWGIHERITWYRWFWTQLGAPAPVALIAEAA
jgi:DNA (cytosine-5)-methyltransferase 1